MSEELRDSLGRLKVTPETEAWLEMQRRLTGRSKNEIAREALHQRAVRDRDELSRKSKLLDALWPREGSPGKTGEDRAGSSE